MKKILRSASCMVIVLVLLSSILAGCGGTKEKQQEVTTKGSMAETAVIVKEAVNKTGLPILNEPVTYKLMVKKYTGDKTSWTEKECFVKAEAETGMKFDLDEIQATAWNEKMGVTLASGEIPDAIVGGIPNFTFYLDLFLPLTDMIKEYAPALYQFYEENPNYKTIAIQSNGEIYSMPLGQLHGRTANNYSLSINKAWLDKLNLKMPETADELYSVLKAFKENDPNGNSKQDEIPYSFCEDPSLAGISSIESMIVNFGLVNGGNYALHYVMVENKKVFFIGADQRFYEYLSFMHKLKEEGLIDPDGFTQKASDFLAKGQQELFGLLTHHSYDDIFVGINNSKDYNAIIPMKDSNGKRTTPKAIITGDFFPNQFVISKNCQNPEALVRLYDYSNSDLEMKLLWSFGPEDIVWSKTVEGTLEKATTFPEGISTFAELRHTMSLGMVGFWLLTPEEMGKFAVSARDAKITERGVLYEPYFNKEYIPYGNDTVDTTQKRNEMFVEISSYMKNFIAEAVIKGIDENKWNEHMKKLKLLKVDEFVNDYQTYYDNVAANMSK